MFYDCVNILCFMFFIYKIKCFFLHCFKKYLFKPMLIVAKNFLSIFYPHFYLIHNCINYVICIICIHVLYANVFFFIIFFYIKIIRKRKNENLQPFYFYFQFFFFNFNFYNSVGNSLKHDQNFLFCILYLLIFFVIQL